MKIFISGKISGERINECRWKFYKARSEVRRLEIFTSAEDATIIEPLDLPGIVFGISHQEAMDICLKELESCTHIYMLRDWKDSKGATMEHERAKELGIDILYQ